MQEDARLVGHLYTSTIVGDITGQVGVGSMFQDR